MHVNITWWSSVHNQYTYNDQLRTGSGYALLRQVPYVINATAEHTIRCDLLDKYAPDTKALFPEDVWESMKVDGKSTAYRPSRMPIS